MTDKQTVLKLFHPLVARWFSANLGTPTEVQQEAWGQIAAGANVLITAPTGSGKTLAAFLWAINELVAGNRPMGRTSVLYVSPLKALNNDVQRNLIKPLEQVRRLFDEAGADFPPIQVLTRSGDTPQSERRRMLHAPPEILITTPESLNLLLSSAGGRSLLGGIATVILDEIHAVLASKRGVHLITAVDRLVPLAGEFQRIALSATVRPLQTVAEFVGGYRMTDPPQAPQYTPRPVQLVAAATGKRYQLKIRLPEADAPAGGTQDSFWQPYVREIKNIIARNRSTLLFANSRRLCEKLTHLINEDEPAPLAYAHHGSLSREIRTEVERRLKAGELRAIVATNSLELGIDIGALDEVVLIQSPASFSSTIQRIGRAGHRVGETSRGTLLPIHAQDVLQAAVLAGGIAAQDIEAIQPVRCPLDVLAQVIVSMAAMETWDIDALYALLRTSTPYRSLSREQFLLVLDMLAGRYAGSRLRELKPRLAIDRLENRVTARKGALQALYLSGGTIPDRGYFHLRHQETGAKIGELDEEFVWEASIGQTFTLGTQNWRVERITHNDVFVLPTAAGSTVPPFWRAEENLRDFHLSERMGELLEVADERLADPRFQSLLERRHDLEAGAAAHLIEFLQRQKESTGCALPHRHHLVIEHVSTGPGGYQGNQVVLHTIWGGRVNRPFAMALEAAWEARYGQHIQVYVASDCILLVLPHPVSSEEILSLVDPATLQGLLRKRLEGSGFFGARFRECAGRALLLTRRSINERVPLWLTRLRSQRLMDAILQYEDFPILLEAWRTCLQDEFDLAALESLLSELETGAISWSEAHTGHPSPMAQSVTWQQINQYMYMDDAMGSAKSSQLRPDLIRDLVHSPQLRPGVSGDLAVRFESKRRRMLPGYAPDSAADLLEWVKERVVIPDGEWQALLQGMEQDHGTAAGDMLESIVHRLVRLHPPEAEAPLVAALENVPQLSYGFYDDSTQLQIEELGTGSSVPPAHLADASLAEEERDEVFTTLLSDWMQFYGPMSVAFACSTLGVHRERLLEVVAELVDSERLITGALLKGSDEELICDSQNYEILLRMLRTEARPSFEALQSAKLPLFLAKFQKITNPAQAMDGLFQSIMQLACCPLPAELWETEIFPSRLSDYDPSQLDSLIQQSDLQWIGRPGRQVCFCFEADLDLLQEESDSGPQPPVDSDVAALFPDPTARYDFAALLRLSGTEPAELVQKLWEEVWCGAIVNDTFAALRHGIETGFKVTDVAGRLSKMSVRRRSKSGRSTYSMWQGSLPRIGNWQRVPRPESGDDPIEREERNKERARLLLDRYGILFRELLRNESPAFSWRMVFRALRLMELSGEVLTGYFFEGIPGPQFISHRTFRMLRRQLPEDAIYWLSATDPVSLCGIPLDAFKGGLPRRVAGTHLVYHGSKLAIISQRRGKNLTISVPAEDPHLASYFGFLQHQLMRRFLPRRHIVIEQINGEDAAASPYLDAFRIGFDVSLDFRKIVLYRKRSSRPTSQF